MADKNNDVATAVQPFNDKLPLRELLRMLPEKQEGSTPNRKCLRENHTPIAVYVSQNQNYVMKVYENGFVLVEAFKRWTVVRLSDCNSGYSYSSNVPAVEKVSGGATPFSIDREMLLEQPWSIRVALTAEDQLERNNEAIFAKLICKHPDIAEDKDYTLGGYYTFEDDLLFKMHIQEALMKLTEKQLEVLQRYYFAGYTQEEIARMLGISAVAVKDRLKGALNRLRKLLAPETSY